MFGIYTRVRFATIKIIESSQSRFFQFRRSSKTFTFLNQQYHYYISNYNYTWRNERTIEVPIMAAWLEKYQDKKILEVGNVMSHYIQTQHLVLDKYEKAEGVVNEDVVSFKSPHKYDLIISVSTLEHVGFDEPEKEPTKVLKGIKNLVAHLKKGGKLVVTHPLGYNPHLDKYIKDRKIKFNEYYLMVRETADNKWREVRFNSRKKIKYNQPFPYANGVLIGVLTKLK